jgi:hypothetical protein
MSLLVSLALACLASCASNAFDVRLKQANDSVTAVVRTTDLALNARAITADQAQAVSTIAHQVGPLLDAAQAAEAVNDPTADAKLNAVNDILAGLKAYVPPTTQK